MVSQHVGFTWRHITLAPPYNAAQLSSDNIAIVKQPPSSSRPHATGAVSTMAKTLEASPFDEFIQSHLFTFYIGEEKKPYVVHSGAVAASSDYFTALVNGDMTESLTRSAELNDVEPADFGRYLEFVYRYDYTVPHWTHDAQNVEPSNGPGSNVGSGTPKERRIADAVVVPPPPAGYPWDDPVIEPEPVPVPYEEPYIEPEPVPVPESYEEPYTEPSQPRQQMIGMNLQDTRSRFENRNYLSHGDPKKAMLQNFEPRSNSNAQQNYTPIFLAHARLYTFAGMRLVDSLKQLALHKLHRTLLDFQLYNQRVGDVLALARYAYENGPDRGADGKLDELRELVVEYMAGEVATLGKHGDFVKLLEEGGEFVGDFWALVR